MKIILNLVVAGSLVLCFVSSSSAQFIPKGSIVGGGGFSFQSGKNKSDNGTFDVEYKQTSVSFTPTLQYYIIDNLGVGAALSLRSTKVKDSDGNYESSEGSVTFGPLVRYYFTDGPFLQGYFGFGSEKSKITSGTTTGESTFGVTEYELGFGYSVKVTETILLDPMFGYGGFTNKNKDTDLKSSYSGLFLRVGFSLILGKP